MRVIGAFLILLSIVFTVSAQKNYEEVLKIAESVLAKNFVEVNSHMAAQIAYQETATLSERSFTSSWLTVC